MSLSYAPAACPHFMSLHHVPISHPCNMSLFHIPVTCPHFRPCNMFLFEFMSLQHGSISYLCSMFPFYVHATVLSLFCAPATWPYPMTLEHVPISCPYNIVISHPCKISSLFLSPCNISPFHVVATCHYSTSLRHFLILRPCNISLFHILATWFCFISPAACPYFMSSLLISYP